MVSVRIEPIWRRLRGDWVVRKLIESMQDGFQARETHVSFKVKSAWVHQPIPAPGRTSEIATITSPILLKGLRCNVKVGT